MSVFRGDGLNAKKSGHWKNEERPGSIPAGLSGSAQAIDGFNFHYFVVELIAGDQGFGFYAHFVNVDGIDRIFQDIGNRFVIVYSKAHKGEYAQISI